MSNNFVQQESTMSPKEIIGELKWIRGKMYETLDGLINVLNYPINNELFSEEIRKENKRR